MSVTIGKKEVGHGKPCYIIAEIGINHNGDINIAKQLMQVAADAGCDAVKFQKRTPLLQVPVEKRNVVRDTPWGEMTTLAYRERIELSLEDYQEIDRFAKELGVDWFASPWDKESVDFLMQFDPVAFKIASPTLTRLDVLRAVAATGKPVFMSTGMSTMKDVKDSVAFFDKKNLIILHCVSDYPAKDEDINLPAFYNFMIDMELKKIPIGYSGHEVGILPSVLATATYMACVVERHVTLDRGMKGSDHGASLEPKGLALMVRDIRRAERLMESDGVKKITEGEKKQIARLRL